MSTEQLPPGWRKVKFGDVVRQVKDKVDPETAGIERYVAGEHMDTDDLRIRRWGEVGDGYLGPAFTMRFKPGQVLYGSRRTYLRKVALADFEGICANTTFVVESASDDLLPEFLPYVMTTEAFHEHSIKQSKGSVNPYINFSDLKWYEFALPPLDEQKRIIDLLAACDEQTERLRTAKAAQDRLLRALMHQMREWLKAAPTMSLGSAVDLQPGRQRSPKYGGGVRARPYLRAANLKLDYIDLSDVLSMDFSAEEESKYAVRAGDVLLVEGGDPDKVGAPAFVGSDIPTPMCIQNTVIRARATDRGVLHPRYLYWILRSSFVAGDFERIATGTKLYHLGLRKLAPYPVPVPTDDEQAAFVMQLDGIHGLGLTIERSLESAGRLSSSVREEVLRGATDVLH